MKLALYQMKMSDSIQDNFQKSLDAIEEATKQGTDFIYGNRIVAGSTVP